MTTPQVLTNTVLPQEPKAGYQTTEFWVTVITAVIGILVGLGLIGPDFAKHHESLVNALALLGSLIAPGLYALSRGLVKKSHVAAVSAVQTASINQTGSPLPVTTAGEVVTQPITGQVGTTETGLALVDLVGAILLVVGIILVVAVAVGGAHHFAPYLPGTILAAIGLVLLYFDGPLGRTRL